MNDALRKTGSSLVTLAALVALWWAASAALGNPKLLPGPWRTISESFPSFAVFGRSDGNDAIEAGRTLAWHAWESARRAMLGTTIGGALGVLTGLIVFALGPSRRGARALLGAAKSAPLFSLIPLFVYWFSGREVGIVAYVIVAVFMVVAIACSEAAVNVPRQFIWQATLSGAGPLVRLWTVVLPAIAPEVVLTFRWVIGLSWAFTLGSEYLASRSSGLGFLAYQSYLYADVGKLIVLAVVYSALGAVSLVGFDTVSGRFVSVRPPRR